MLKNVQTKVPVDVIEQLKKTYAAFTADDILPTSRCYAENTIYKTPGREINGRVYLEDYLASMSETICDLSIIWLDQLVSANTAYIKWDATFRYVDKPRQLVSIRGVSQLQFDSHINFQEDVYYSTPENHHPRSNLRSPLTKIKQSFLPLFPRIDRVY